MRRLISAAASVLMLVALVSCSQSTRQEYLLEKGWRFTKGDGDYAPVKVDDSAWESVTVPHDWAIYGPFDANNDAQVVAIEQNFETRASLKTGRTGGLPYVGVGWYRLEFDAPGFGDGKSAELVFDGAMSQAKVYLNGQFVGEWPYGYNSFHFDVSEFLRKDGGKNTLAVRLENLPESSRWYPGAGLYRNVHLIVTDRVHVPVWGTQLICEDISEQSARVDLKVKIRGAADGIRTDIIAPDGRQVASSTESTEIEGGRRQLIDVSDPQLWSPESPSLYKAVTSLYVQGKKVDEYTTTFGIRTIELVSDKGFLLNGKVRKFQGVCNHHDLGPLGSAINEAALRRQLTLLKEMGCDAVRTSHNMPAPELVRLCDEMGFMMMLEPFDEWDIRKCRNGYHLFFDEWAEKDMVNMLHQYRNNPCVVLWSIGNEVPSQCDASGYETARFLVDICHREDPTRFTTCGMDQVLCVLENGLAGLLDVPGFNYRVHLYEQAYDVLPHKLVLGSETASTISSRGVYKFPVEKTARVRHDDLQCSSYDLEYCGWSNVPDIDFAMAQDKEWEIGQFVWTGFDYLGEPTPYNLMPNHSSNFGIIDLASIPKDRYYLYRSVWRPDAETLHILPHWTWPGREGEVTPVFVYTNYPSAELFVNGKSQGRRSKDLSDEQGRYRLMWNEVVYEPGEVKVVAYDAAGKAVAEQSVRTAGEPDHLELLPDRNTLAADGKDLAYVEVRVVDKDGNLCPNDNRLASFSTAGAAGSYRAAANGDPTCLDLFHLPQMHFFGGRLTAIVQAAERGGQVTLTASAPGVQSGSVRIAVKTRP
ncbi:MAG: DUF4982 domain-containing protein [Bacteroidales bacterium]|nr:DUF4982 domain-containing protein [Bacteroidales bacterium]